jgi:hypothetical protein
MVSVHKLKGTLVYRSGFVDGGMGTLPIRWPSTASLTGPEVGSQVTPFSAPEGQQFGGNGHEETQRKCRYPLRDLKRPTFRHVEQWLYCAPSGTLVCRPRFAASLLVPRARAGTSPAAAPAVQRSPRPRRSDDNGPAIFSSSPFFHDRAAKRRKPGYRDATGRMDTTPALVGRVPSWAGLACWQRW